MGFSRAANKTRKAAVAGRFYPADAKEIHETLKHYFSTAKKPLSGLVQALIVPHAGWVFSGQIAASAYNQISPDRAFDRIFLLGPSHQQSFRGASIYKSGRYETPSGEVSIDSDTAQRLIKHNEHIGFFEQAHTFEHNIEVQIPFLKHHLKQSFKIVPMLMGSNSDMQIQSIADSLKPYFTPKNLFIISSDFSHYPDYNDAVQADEKTALAIKSLSIEKLEQACNDNEKTRSLACSLCGIDAVKVLLALIDASQEYQANIIDYSNSGDSSYGSKKKVVGYYAMSITKNAAHENKG